MLRWISLQCSSSFQLFFLLHSFFKHFFFFFKSVPIISLIFILVYIKSRILLLPSLIQFCLLPSSCNLCFKFYFFPFYTLFLFCTLTTSSPSSLSNYFFLPLVTHILFCSCNNILMLSPHLLIFAHWLLILWLLLHFFSFIPRGSLFCISDLKFYFPLSYSILPSS